MKKLLLLLLSFYVALIILMPKANLYYTLKQYLQSEHIVLSQEMLNDRWFALKIEGLKVYYDGIESAEVEQVTVWPWLLFNRVHTRNVHAGKDLKKMFDFLAEDIVVRHSVIDPVHVKIKADGNFGTIEGSIDLAAGKLKLLCVPTKRFKHSSAFRELFRKTEEGFVHESNIW